MQIYNMLRKKKGYCWTFNSSLLLSGENFQVQAANLALNKKAKLELNDQKNKRGGGKVKSKHTTFECKSFTTPYTFLFQGQNLKPVYCQLLLF